MDESIVPDEIVKLEQDLSDRVAGQDRAIKQFVRMHEFVLGGLTPQDRPLGVVLLVGPTGSGKTHIAETFCDIMKISLIKVDCAEFQQSHEIAKLIGSPPGYLGHKDTKPVITKEAITKRWSEPNAPKYSMILFDEIEKAHNAFHQILLGIMDRGTLTLGTNETVDLKNCIIVVTSNLGSGEVKKLLQTGGYGFVKKNEGTSVSGELALDEDIYRASKDAVKKFFSPEFFNRIDLMVVFRSLTEDVLRRILDIELKIVQDRVLKAGKFIHIDVTNRGKELLIAEGTSKEYGARHLRRSIERFLVSKITRALTTKQAQPGDMILADHEPGAKGLVLDIAKGAMEIPQPTEKPVCTAIVKKPKHAFINPEDRQAASPYRSAIDPEYCGRCGFRWYDKHLCADLTDSPLSRFRKKMDERRLKS
jgi:ATP-dependent Clp protease ATP-binding subunit ClpA